MIGVTRIIYKYYEYFSKVMNLNEWVYESNQTYVKRYEFDDNVVSMLSATCTYKSMW